jgi:hypothetical protein
MLWKLLGAGVLGLALISLPAARVKVETKDQRAAAQKLFNDGNYQEAFEAFRALALNPENDAEQVGSDLQLLIASLRRRARCDP